MTAQLLWHPQRPFFRCCALLVLAGASSQARQPCGSLNSLASRDCFHPAVPVQRCCQPDGPFAEEHKNQGICCIWLGILLGLGL